MQKFQEIILNKNKTKKYYNNFSMRKKYHAYIYV